MQYTSAEAAKLLKRLNEELNNLLNLEKQSCSFNAALGEDLESVRPKYDYCDMQNKIHTLEMQIIKVKHAINKFNVSQTVPDFTMTIDQLLVYIPMLTNKKAKLNMMAARLPKQRENIRAFSANSSVIDYNYANYDIAKVRDDYNKISDELAKAQNALDVINTSVKFDIDL